jgi:hypothetical protein
MKSSSTTLLIAIITFFTLGTSTKSLANERLDKGVYHSQGIHKMSPKQFSKGYLAQKKEYESINNNSTKKMIRKRKGSWLQRWYSRNF